MVSEHPETASIPNAEAMAGDTAAGTDQGLSGPALFKFNCVRNAAYHEDREHYYASVHRRLMFIVVALGTLSIGASLAHENIWASLGTLIAVLAGLVDVVWNVDGLAREHSILRRRCYDLLARMEAGEPMTVLQPAFARVIADEPPAMHAVNALAFNAAVDALGRPKDQKYVLAPWQVFLRHVLRFRPNEFPTAGHSSRA
jgi:hypothetical protein